MSDYGEDLYVRRQLWKRAKGILELPEVVRRNELVRAGWIRKSIPTTFELSELLIKYHKENS